MPPSHPSHPSQHWGPLGCGTGVVFSWQYNTDKTEGKPVGRQAGVVGSHCGGARGPGGRRGRLLLWLLASLVSLQTNTGTLLVTGGRGVKGNNEPRSGSFSHPQMNKWLQTVPLTQDAPPPRTFGTQEYFPRDERERVEQVFSSHEERRVWCGSQSREEDEERRGEWR